MSRKHKGKSGKHSSGGKGAGYEYWSRRPFSGVSPGKDNKKITHRIERAKTKRNLTKE